MSRSLPTVLLIGLAACKVVDVVGNTNDGPSCEQEEWAQCAEFDGTGRTPFDPATYEMTFQAHSHVWLTGIGCETSGDCTAYVDDGVLSLNAEDAGYGMDVLRLERPFDFAGREGHIHFRSDLRGQPRILQVVHVSPELSNTLPDLRNNVAVNAGPALTVTYFGGVGQPFLVFIWRDGAVVQVLDYSGDLGLVAGNLYDVDIFIARDHTRILVDGATTLDEAHEDIGFDRAYVYIGQVSNDPVKDGIVGDAANRLLWDDIGFDGPRLPRNGLTPIDKQDVLFRAWDALGCSVRGVTAVGQTEPIFILYDTWRVQLDASEPAVEVGEITCTRGNGVGTFMDQDLIGDIQVVRQ